jgi:hypothetical protein
LRLHERERERERERELGANKYESWIEGNVTMILQNKEN